MLRGAGGMPPSAEHIRLVFERYAKYLSEGNVDKIVLLFSPDAILEDPVGTPVHRGREEIRNFFQRSFEQTGGRILFTQEGAVRIHRQHAACAFIAKCDQVTPSFQTETIDIARFDEEGLIVSWLAIWGETNHYSIENLV